MKQKTSYFAIASLVLSLISYPLTTSRYSYLVVAVCIVAIILGVIGYRQIKKGLYSGKNIAIAGIILGSITPLLILLAIIAILTDTPWIYPLDFLLTK